MKRTVTTRSLSGRQLLGIARHHAVLTDRTREEGGTDIGCTSGELLLLAIGSCATGSVRKYLQAQGLPYQNLSVTVSFAADDEPRERDLIVVAVNVDEAARPHADAITVAAVGGGVTSRIHAGTGLQVRMAGING